MKVKVSITVEIDPAAWEQDFGVDATDKTAIRNDVRSYVEGTISSQFEAIGHGIVVTNVSPA